MWEAKLGSHSLFSCLSYKAFALCMFLLGCVFWALTKNLLQSLLEQIKQSYYCLTTVLCDCSSTDISFPSTCHEIHESICSVHNLMCWNGSTYPLGFAMSIAWCNTCIFSNPPIMIQNGWIAVRGRACIVFINSC